MASYEELREKHAAEAMSLLPEYDERLDWSADRLHQERQKKLRALVRVAKERSPWHQKRLAAVDPDTLTEAELERIPPMTKGDLMDHWDEIVTDSRLNLDLVNGHLEQLKTDQYLLDEFHAAASGGSTGRRGVFVYDWTTWTLFYIMLARRAMRAMNRAPETSETPPIRAVVAAGKASHLSRSINQTFGSTLGSTHYFPITLPIKQIVDGLNTVQPKILFGYPSALYLLAHEARAGRLRIAPKGVGASAEPLLPEIRAAIEAAWGGAEISNYWACSEGGSATPCGEGQGMHLEDDFFIIEPVDLEGRPVPAGTTSAKIYLTNLFNPTLPLIRYEVTDEVTLLDEPCPCGSAHRRIADVMGRLDDSFTYGGQIQIHPHLFRSALGGERNILEYQVQQTLHGAEISIRCGGEVDVSSLGAKIAKGLEELGLENPKLAIAQVDRFERLDTGKLKRFLPLAAL